MKAGVLLLRGWIVRGKGESLGVAGETGGADVGADITHGELEEVGIRWGRVVVEDWLSRPG